MKTALTVARIRGFEPKASRYMVADGGGLAIEVMPNAARYWRYRYRLGGRANTVGLGKFPEVGLADARARRDALAAAVRDGDSPADQKRKERAKALRSVTVREFAERYYAEVVQEARKEPRAVRRYLERDIYPALGSMALGKVNAQDMQVLIFARRDAGRRQAALAIRNLLKRIWDYAITCGAAAENPAKATPAKFIARATKRTRKLSEAEIGVFLRALDAARIEERYKISLLLILLNLVRKSELRRARWEHINLERGEWTIPEENAKNKRELLIPLSRQSVELFRRLRALDPGGVLVLPMAISRTQPLSASTLNRVLYQVPTGLPHFTIHDLRRTASTRLNEMEYNKLWIEKALNHTEKGVSGIYNRAEYARQRREMLQAWANYVDSLRGFPV
jgi:integrase